MARTVSDFIWSRLHEWGVRRVYGYPGDGIGGLIAALQRREKDIEFVQARHEEMASLMASGESRFTGKVGVCIATSGPGAVHLLNGLYDARLDHRPVVALVGQQARSAMGSHYQQISIFSRSSRMLPAPISRQLLSLLRCLISLIGPSG